MNKTITFLFVQQSSLSEEEVDLLYNMSPMRNEDGGFSFLIPVSWLESLLNDMKYDAEKGHFHPLLNYVENLIATLKKENRVGLFVCNDKYYEPFAVES